MSLSEFELFGDSLPGDLAVSRFVLREQLSLPFRAEVEFSTLSPEFEAHKALNSSVALRVSGAADDSRLVHGMVTETRFERVVGERLHFSLVLRPTLWGLSLREDCRIFQNASSADILKTLLTECGIIDSAQFHFENTYPTREFVVQYRESTLN